jgi:hypothetical protein
VAWNLLVDYSSPILIVIVLIYGCCCVTDGPPFPAAVVSRSKRAAGLTSPLNCESFSVNESGQNGAFLAKVLSGECRGRSGQTGRQHDGCQHSYQRA